MLFGSWKRDWETCQFGGEWGLAQKPRTGGWINLLQDSKDVNYDITQMIIFVKIPFSSPCRCSVFVWRCYCYRGQRPCKQQTRSCQKEKGWPARLKGLKQVTCADTDGFAEIEDGLFPVSGRVLGAGAQVERVGRTCETNVKVPYQSLQETNSAK